MNYKEILNKITQLNSKIRTDHEEIRKLHKQLRMETKNYILGIDLDKENRPKIEIWKNDKQSYFPTILSLSTKEWEEIKQGIDKLLQ